MSLERIRNTEREDAGWNGGVEVSRELVVEIETGGWEGGGGKDISRDFN